MAVLLFFLFFFSLLAVTGTLCKKKNVSSPSETFQALN